MSRVPLSVPVAIGLSVLMSAGAACAATPSDDTLSIQLMILGLCITPAIYFLPSIFAATRDHPAANGIFTVNLLLGWTVVGWVVAMAWVFRARNRAVRSAQTGAAPSVTPVLAMVDVAAQEIEDLAGQRLQHLISEDEYNLRKKAILDRWKAAPMPAIALKS